MKLSLFEHIKQLLKPAVLCGAAILLASCGGIDESSTGGSTENGTVTPTGNDMVKIRVAVDEGRTAYPVVESLAHFKEFELTCDGKIIGRWIESTSEGLSAYALMNTDSIPVSATAHTFVLTGTEKSGACYRGTIAQTIAADTLLSFTLSFVDIASVATNGTVAFDISFPTTGLVKKIVLNRYKYDSLSSRDEPTEILDTQTTTDTSAGKWMPEPQEVVGGKYLYECVFYGGSDSDYVFLDTLPEIAYVSAGLTTTIKIAYTDSSDIHRIIYVNADEADGVTFTEKPLYYTSERDITLPTPERNGYTFAGWYESIDDDGNGVGTQITGWTGTSRTDDVTVYATWTANNYDVNYYINLPADGELSENPFATVTAAYGSTTTAPATTPERTGYSFVRWTNSASGAAFNFDQTKITGKTNLYAVWSYAVTFATNGDDVTGTMEDETLHTSWEWTEKKLITANAYVRDGYTFLGWASAGDATEKEYFDGDIVSFGAAKTLYAVWLKDGDGYVVTFEPNGGSVVPPQVAAQDGTGTVTAPVSTKEDYALAGWFTSTDNGATLSETAFDFTTPITDNITLYAKWVPSTYYVSASGNASNAGTKGAPYNKVSTAVSKINSTGSADIDYVIVVSGEIKDHLIIRTSELAETKAKSLTIRGATGSDVDKINGSANGTTLTLGTKVPVTLKDIAIINGGTSDNYYGAGIDFPSGNLTLESGTLIANNESTYISSNYNYGTGLAIYISGGTITMKDGAVIRDNNMNNRASYAAGVRVTGGTFIMDGGEIYNNNTTKAGGGVYVEGGTFTMNGGTIRDNTASGGGGVYLSSGTFIMNGGTIRDNTASSNGGAVYLYGGTFKMGGSAYIPYGGGKGKNDVYSNSRVITVAESLTSQPPVATIVCYSYYSSTTILSEAGDVTLADEVPKFALANTNYFITSTGKIATKTSNAITYKDGGSSYGTTFSGTHEEGYPTAHIYGQGITTKLRGATKAKYSFGGWYTTYSCDGEPVTELTDENCSSSITLYAKWTLKDYYTITYKEAGGGSYSGNNSSSLLKSFYYPDDLLTLVDGKKSDYVFDGWYTSDDDGETLSDKAITVLTDENCSSNITLYAKWKPHYTLTYRDEGDQPFSADKSAFPTYRNGGETIVLPKPEKYGYIFKGWYMSYNCTGARVTTLTDENCTANLTLYAKWVVQQVQVAQPSWADLSFKTEKNTYEITLTGAEGFTDYEWSIEGWSITSVFPDATISKDGSTLVLKRESMVDGYDYRITLHAVKYSMEYAVTISVKD